MTGKHDDTDVLETFFDAARADPSATPSEALLQRIMADAAAEQFAATAPAPVRGKRKGPIAALVAALGGWQPVGGLAVATLAGVWIGFGLSSTYLPDGLDSLTSAGTEVYLSELSGGFDLTLETEEG
ncbi:hypothetical protein [Shimia biformata]|uniref:hypothetical protein n=1 Tax=Shimia biformata TaxID=1294299 RepID=UPI0019516333|nr:hypothetical protein [Shimia biformata]